MLLTSEDDFNALACTILADNETAVYRLAPRQPGHGVVAPFASAETVFAPGLTRHGAALRHGSGASISIELADDPVPPGTDVLFRITPDGALTPATGPRPAAEPAGTLVLPGPAARRDEPAR